MVVPRPSHRGHESPGRASSRTPLSVTASFLTQPPILQHHGHQFRSSAPFLSQDSCRDGALRASLIPRVICPHWSLQAPWSHVSVLLPALLGMWASWPSLPGVLLPGCHTSPALLSGDWRQQAQNPLTCFSSPQTRGVSLWSKTLHGPSFPRIPCPQGRHQMFSCPSSIPLCSPEGLGFWKQSPKNPWPPSASFWNNGPWGQLLLEHREKQDGAGGFQYGQSLPCTVPICTNFNYHDLVG